MNDREFRKLLDRQVVLLDAVKKHGVLAAVRHKAEMERGARAVIAECYRRLEAPGEDVEMPGAEFEVLPTPES